MASDPFVPQAPRPCAGRFRNNIVRCSAPRAVEHLETRALLSVALNSAGWTQVTPSADSRIIYVSSSTGSDANTGLSPDSPVATIAKGYSLLRNDEPDWLLFKRGDTFTGSFSYFDDSGRSPQEPMVVSNYGDSTLPLPVIDAGANTAFRAGTANHDLYVMGLNFTSSTHDPNSPNFTGKGSYGFYDLGGTTDLLIEDCTFSYFVNDITFQGYNGPLSDISIRRNEIFDAYNVGGHAQGLYADSVTNLTITDNTFDYDGWNSTVPGAGPTIYNHDCYLHSSNVNCVVTGNTFADAGSFGLEARAGGVVDDNLFINDPYGFAFGLVNGSTATPGGVSGEAIGNVVIQPRIDGHGWGIGALIGNLAPGGNTVISGNIFANAPGDTAPAMEFQPGNAVSNPQQEAGLHSLLVTNNTAYGWGFGILMSGKYSGGTTGADSISDVVISNNDFQNNLTPRIVSHDNAFDPANETWEGNTYSSAGDPSQWFNLYGARTSFASWQANVEPTAIAQTVSFVDPTRTIDTYMATLNSTGGLDAFIAGARDLSEDNWNPVYLAGAVTNYIQAGYTPTDAAPSSANTKSVDPPTAVTTSPTPTIIPAPALGPVQAIVTTPASTSTGSPTPSTPPTTAAPVAVNPPVVSRVVLNYANAHHTAVSSVTLIFSKPVISSSAMVSLASTTAASAAGAPSIGTFVSNPSGDGKTWQVTFFGQPGNTLPAGQYALTVRGGSILTPAGQPIGPDTTTTFDTADPTNQTRARRILSEAKLATAKVAMHSMRIVAGQKPALQT
ncbi:MAG TPA: right-handed parallel beta-helix repeat-containing protein [Tepidisphaeraceae bacterium]|jgi:hypothetical protein|nr:right-handed parallel beta-helix repeat-containing protein [Tepidisphaeraceae bacterium]